MASIREPVLTTVAIVDLRPTQITVGMREVLAKRKRWRETGAKKGGKFLGKHVMPVILGPKHRHYVIDHHHLARALHDEGVKAVAVTVVANLGELDGDAVSYTHLDVYKRQVGYRHRVHGARVPRAGCARDITPITALAALTVA